MKFGNRFFIFNAIIFILIACKQNPLDVDLPKKDLSLKFINADSLLINSADSAAITSTHNHLKNILDELYLYEISMNLQERDSTLFSMGLYSFYKSDYVQQLEQEKSQLYKLLPDLNDKATLGFRYLNYHFPDLALPNHVLFMNKMFSSINVSDSLITVGLENYLGAENEVIKSIPSDQLYQWQKDAMNISFLPRDIVLSWIQAHLFEEMDESLARHIIQAGKVLYILKACFPKQDDAYILRYSEEDIKWATKNEFAFWDYIVREELLFKNDPREKTNFLNEGPYTVGLPEKGPDRLGQFLGFQMVKQFMKQNKEISLYELLEINYNKILQAYEID